MVELEERIERSERGKDMGECMSIGEEGEVRTWVGERKFCRVVILEGIFARSEREQSIWRVK